MSLDDHKRLILIPKRLGSSLRDAFNKVPPVSPCVHCGVKTWSACSKCLSTPYCSDACCDARKTEHSSECEKKVEERGLGDVDDSWIGRPADLAPGAQADVWAHFSPFGLITWAFESAAAKQFFLAAMAAHDVDYEQFGPVFNKYENADYSDMSPAEKKITFNAFKSGATPLLLTKSGQGPVIPIVKLYHQHSAAHLLLAEIQAGSNRVLSDNEFMYLYETYHQLCDTEWCSPTTSENVDSNNETGEAGSGSSAGCQSSSAREECPRSDDSSNSSPVTCGTQSSSSSSTSATSLVASVSSVAPENSSISTEKLRRCNTCRNKLPVSQLKLCSRCKYTRYCSVKCQREGKSKRMVVKACY